MGATVSSTSYRMLFLNTLAFMVCFAVWIFNSVLVTFLVDNGVFDWSSVQVGWLFGIPILTGAIFRLPMGILTDKIGGKWVFGGLLFFCAIPVFLLSMANDYWSFALLSFCFGLAGSGFAVGIAYTSVWFPKEWQGRALGIFGVGNAGAAVTTLLAPTLLLKLTNYGQDLEQWRTLPKIYAAVLVIMALVFLVFAKNMKSGGEEKTLSQRLSPLGNIRVWRFGLYYFLVFGCFVAFSQWLVPYFTTVYSTSLVLAGILASSFSMPSSLIRAIGGWISDKYGARKVMDWVFKFSIAFSLLLIFPKMDVYTPGKGVTSNENGNITFVSDSLIKINDNPYLIQQKPNINLSDKNSVLPVKMGWQTPSVKVGEEVRKKQMIAEGTSQIHFSANMWVFVVLVFGIGITWGIGMAGVYKFIPDYFPNDVGTVGGMVGVIGGLGGFVCPILFGYLLEWTGLWTSSWMMMVVLAIICFLWLKHIVSKLVKRHAPNIPERGVE